MFHIDAARARAVARQLLEAYAQVGIFGTQTMPEDLVPPEVVPGSEEHLRFISLTVAIDYMRDADQLWNAARASYADAATSYLFLPEVVAQTGLVQLIGGYAKVWPFEEATEGRANLAEHLRDISDAL